MLTIAHRVNTLSELRRVPQKCGVEIDVRDYDGGLRLVHDPLESGELLSDFLAQYRHADLVVNVKCAGLVPEARALLHRNNIKSYFFLDLSAPECVDMARFGNRQFAVRFSDYEPVEAALAFAGHAEWVWVDAFDRFPLTPKIHTKLKSHFRICLVSPELQGHPREWIADFRKELDKMPVDAVCTDHRDDWSR